MNVTCPSCKTRYSVDDARVPPSGVTIKCPKCAHTFVAKPPRAQSAVALPGNVDNHGPATAASGSPPAPPGGRSAPPPVPGAHGAQAGAHGAQAGAHGAQAGAHGAQAPVPLPGRPGQPPPPNPSAGPAVPLPGTSGAAVPLPGTPGGAPPPAGGRPVVALPGSAAPPTGLAQAPTSVGDLGLSDDIPLPAPRSGQGPFAGTPQAPGGRRVPKPRPRPELGTRRRRSHGLHRQRRHFGAPGPGFAPPRIQSPPAERSGGRPVRPRPNSGHAPEPRPPRQRRHLGRRHVLARDDERARAQSNAQRAARGRQPDGLRQRRSSDSRRNGPTDAGRPPSTERRPVQSQRAQLARQRRPADPRFRALVVARPRFQRRDVHDAQRQSRPQQRRPRQRRRPAFRPGS